MLTLKIFTHGKKVTYNGQTYTIDFVTISGYDILLHFREIDDRGLHIVVNADKVECEPTVMQIDPNRIKWKYNRRHLQ